MYVFAMLIHLLPFGPVAGAACCLAGGHYQGGWYRGGVGGTEAGRVGAPEEGRVGSTEAGRWVLPRRSAVNDSSVICSEALFAKVTGNDHSV